MEIEFNPGRFREPGTSFITRREPVSAADTTLPHERIQTLQQSLRDVSQVRPGVVERARALVADVQYPPQDVLDRIATLLAINTKS